MHTATCINEKVSKVSFRMSGAVGGIEKTVKTRRKDQDFNTELICTTASNIISQTGATEIDYLSLDVEGHELSVLNGIDWSTTKINVITAEVLPNSPAARLLLDLGYSIHAPRAPPPQDQWNEFTVRFGYDTLFVHNRVQWGQPE